MALHVDTHKSGWFSVKEACQILDISRQTLYNWTKTNKIQSKVEKKHRFVWLDLNGEYQSEENVSDTDTDLHADLHEKGTNLHSDEQFYSYRLQTLEKDLDYFRRKCDKLEDQLADQSKRHDTIVLGMTNTISDQKLELAEGQHTFNTRMSEFEQELLSTKSDLEAVSNRGFWARLFNR